MRWSARAALLSLLTAVLVSSTLVAPPQASALTTREARMVTRINDARAAHGLRPLRVRSDLTDHARAHSRAMARRGYLYHTRDFRVLCCWSAIAENVGYGSTVRVVHRAFMGSRGHRANILDRGSRGVGVGIVYARGRLWVTEVFRDPR